MVKKSAHKIPLEKGMKDKRFRETEKAILKVFLESSGDITMVEIAKKSGVGRSTIYTHHNATKEIIKDYEKYIMAKYKTIIQNKIKAGAEIRTLTMETLLFIIKNQNIFNFFLEFNDREIFIKMVKVFEENIVEHTHLPKGYTNALRICEIEIAEIIIMWGENDFSLELLKKTLVKIMFLIDSFRTRLAPIC